MNISDTLNHKEWDQKSDPFLGTTVDLFLATSVIWRKCMTQQHYMASILIFLHFEIYTIENYLIAYLKNVNLHQEMSMT